MLLGIAPHVAPATAERVCEVCGCLPLAVRAAASLLEATVDLSPERYLAQLSDERTRLEDIGEEGVDAGVAASLGLSYERLSPGAALVFGRLAVFPAVFGPEAEEHVCEDEEHRHLSELVRRSLVFYDGETGLYRLHDLTRLFAGSRLDPRETYATRKRHAVYYLGLLSALEELFERGGEAAERSLLMFDLAWLNIEAGHAWAVQYADADAEAARLCDVYTDAGGYLLALRQRARARIEWLEVALEAARKLKNRSSEAMHLNNLGLVYKDVGRTEDAEQVFERGLALNQEVGNAAGEAGAAGNLGLLYSRRGEHHRAVEMHERALSIQREIGDRRGVAISLSNLGSAYTYLGELELAGEYKRQALEIFRELHDAQSEALTLINLGNVHKALADEARARQEKERAEAERALASEYYEQALPIARRIGHRRAEAGVLGNLGALRATAGDLKQAVEFFSQALAIAAEEQDAQSAAVSALNVARCLRDLGNAAQAAPYAQYAYEIFAQIGSPMAEDARDFPTELQD